MGKDSAASCLADGKKKDWHDRATHNKQHHTPPSVLNITREAALYLVPSGTWAGNLEVQMLAIANSQNSFGPFAFGFSVVTCVDFDASLIEASKLQYFSLEQLKYDWVLFSQLYVNRHLISGVFKIPIPHQTKTFESRF